MEYLEQEQVCKLLRHCQTVKERLCLTLAYCHGLRVSELAALRLGDIQDGMLRINSLKDSYNAIHTLVELPDMNERELLAQYLAERGPGRPDEALFPAAKRFKHGVDGKRTVRPYTKADHASKQSMDAMIKRVAMRAGIPRPEAHMHALRHGTAMTMVVAGESIHVIQKYMRHKSLASTGFYLHCTDREASARAARAFAGVGVRGDSNGGKQ